MERTELPSALRRYAAKVDDLREDSDGWKFVYLKPGWVYDGVHAIAYDTWEECADMFCLVKPCECEECQDLKRKSTEKGAMR